MSSKLFCVLLGCSICNGRSALVWPTFVCTEPNDLVSLLRNITGQPFPCVESLAVAVKKAPEKSTILSLAAQWPTRTDVTSSAATVLFDNAAQKGLRLYVEFPSGLPAHGDAPSTEAPLNRTTLERIVVVTADRVPLQPGRILNMHIMNYTDFSDVAAAKPELDLVVAKVAGFDNASYGIPQTAKPLLFRLDTEKQRPAMLIAATQLSNFVRRRFAPVAGWQAVVFAIARFAGLYSILRPEQLIWVPTVRPSYSKEEPLPADAEKETFQRAVQWYIKGGMIPDSIATQRIAIDTKQGRIKVGGPVLFEKRSLGNGRMGVFEGFASKIEDDGRQPIGVNLRNDCISETSMAFAFRAALQRQANVKIRTVDVEAAKDESMARNLLNYAWLHGGFSQPWMPGILDPLGDTFGVLAWSSGSKDSFFKDDEARSLLAGLATAALLRTDRWDSTIATAIYANLRLTCRGGFGPESSNIQDVQRSGWRALFDADMSSDKDMYSPHYQSYIWAVYLWAFQQSGYTPLYERAFAGINHMMTRYPSWWQPTMNGILVQRARMLLPLAWLVRANDTSLHRSWLHTVADGLLDRQDLKTGAFRKEVSAEGWRNAARVPNNDDYGTFEAPLNQNNNNPVSDFLYTANFAFLGLHEASAATGNTTLQKAEDRLAQFLVRAQARSSVSQRPELDGAFFRAFDFEKWEVWGSDADAGWGAWAVEMGWTQSWISATFGLRLTNTSLWELTHGSVDLREELEQWRDFFFLPASPDSKPCLNVSHAMQLNFTMETSLGELCAPAPGATISHVQFLGHACGEQKILWESMETMDPRPGMSAAQCTWRAKSAPADWTARWLGSCGVPPTRMLDLPVRICDNSNIFVI